MNNLTRNIIAIDVNVFEHLIDPRNNRDKHIHALFSQLMDDEIKLIVDDQGMISHEYDDRMTPRLDALDEESGEGILLRYWFDPENQKVVQVKLTDELMRAIKRIVSTRKKADRFYVYVAFKEGRVLVTNDKKDILKKRNRLLKLKTRPRLPKGANILSSQEAHQEL